MNIEKTGVHTRSGSYINRQMRKKTLEIRKQETIHRNKTAKLESDPILFRRATLSGSGSRTVSPNVLMAVCRVITASVLSDIEFSRISRNSKTTLKDGYSSPMLDMINSRFMNDSVKIKSGDFLSTYRYIVDLLDNWK